MSGTHTEAGKFAKGNKLGQGNPHIKRVHALRNALFEAVSEKDVYDIVTKLIDQARQGDVMSAREVLDRTLGKAQGNDTLTLATDADAPTNPFVDRLRDNPELALAASDVFRRMAIDARSVRVAPDVSDEDAVLVGTASGSVEQEARVGGIGSDQKSDGDDAAEARQE